MRRHLSGSSGYPVVQQNQCEFAAMVPKDLSTCEMLQAVHFELGCLVGSRDKEIQYHCLCLATRSNL